MFLAIAGIALAKMATMKPIIAYWIFALPASTFAGVPAAVNKLNAPQIIMITEMAIATTNIQSVTV